MKRFFLALTCLALSLTCTSSLQAKDEKGKKPAASKRHHKKGKAPTAASLIADMNEAGAFITREAVKDMNPKSKEERPFWSGLKQASDSLDVMEKAVKTSSPDMLKGLSNLGRSLAQVDAAWGILRKGEKKSQIGRGIVSINKSYKMFLEHYGPSVARYKKGGSLSAEEKSRIAKCDSDLKKFKSGLTKIQGKSKGNSMEARMVADLLTEIDVLLADKCETVQQYCHFIYIWDVVSNGCYAYNDCIEVWYPEFYTTWTTVYTDYHATANVFWESSAAYYSEWSYASESIKAYGDYYESQVTVSSSELTSEETYIESYDEASATVESSEEEKETESEVEEADKDDPEPIYEEVADSEDDSDGDGIKDEADTDDDNDGIPDSADNDDDGDGVPDAEDTDSADDSDGDGINDDEDPDDDNDGVADDQDDDDDGDGVADADDDNDEAMDDDDMDSDDDGIADDMDDDDDNDGINDDADNDDDGDGVDDADDSDSGDEGGDE